MDGDDLRRLPLSMRKTNLARLLRGRPEGIFIKQISDYQKPVYVCGGCREGLKFRSPFGGIFPTPRYLALTPTAASIRAARNLFLMPPPGSPQRIVAALPVSAGGDAERFRPVLDHYQGHCIEQYRGEPLELETA